MIIYIIFSLVGTIFDILLDVIAAYTYINGTSYAYDPDKQTFWVGQQMFRDSCRVQSTVFPHLVSSLE